MSEKNRKNFSSQFKAKVALEAIRGIKTVNEIAQEFGVHPTQVGHWKKLLQKRLRVYLTSYAAPGLQTHLQARSVSTPKSGG